MAKIAPIEVPVKLKLVEFPLRDGDVSGVWINPTEVVSVSRYGTYPVSSRIVTRNGEHVVLGTPREIAKELMGGDNG